MHELSLAEGVLQLIEEAAQQQGFTRVREIRLEIGQLAGVEVEALRFCLDSVLRGSLAESARIVVEHTPGAGWCMPCGVTVPMTALYDPCPRCGGHQVTPTAGRQMRVKDLLVE
jgi:hydrogenase nickel incorporation protein HypA/HybF